MLVLSRKLNERIVIDGGIVVTVVKIDHNQVRLGIEAPPDTSPSSARRLPGVAPGGRAEPRGESRSGRDREPDGRVRRTSTSPARRGSLRSLSLASWDQLGDERAPAAETTGFGWWPRGQSKRIAGAGRLDVLSVCLGP